MIVTQVFDFLFTQEIPEANKNKMMFLYFTFASRPNSSGLPFFKFSGTQYSYPRLIAKAVFC